MENSISIIRKILFEIRKLNYKEKLILMGKFKKVLGPQNFKRPTHSLLELNGLGMEIWKDINIDRYVEQERKWDQ